MPTGDGNLGEGDKSGTRVVKRDNPMFFVQANNAFRLKQCWLIDLDYQYTSPYDYVMYRFTKPTHSLNLAVSKSFLKHDALNVRLSWNDILNKTKNRIDTDYGNFYNSQSNDSVNSWDYHKDCKTHGKGEIVLSLDEYWQDFRPLTHTVNVPVLYFYGRYDRSVGPDFYRGLHFPNAIIRGQTVDTFRSSKYLICGKKHWSSIKRNE